MTEPQSQRVSFFGIGAGKAGSSWLAAMLMQHPRVFVPAQKELHYFNREAPERDGLANPNYGRPLDWYHRFYAAAAPDQLWGDMTPAYLWSSTAAAGIAAYRPDAKLLVTLRNPLETAFSMYLYRIQRGVIGTGVSFAEAMRSDQRIYQNSEMGSNLEAFRERFAPEQFHFVFFEDVRNAPERVIADVCRFLEVDAFTPEGMTERVNETGVPRFPLLARTFRSGLILAKQLQAGALIQRLKHTGLGRALQQQAEARTAMVDKPTIEADAVALVRDRFGGEIAKLETITGRDLTTWRQSLAAG